MQSTFHDEERCPRTVLRVRPDAAQPAADAEPDWTEMMHIVIAALDPFPEACLAVAAALQAAEDERGKVG